MYTAEIRILQLVEQLSGIEIDIPLALDNTWCYSFCVWSVWDPCPHKERLLSGPLSTGGPADPLPCLLTPLYPWLFYLLPAPALSRAALPLI